ncbi:MAG: NADH-quinone oxidoreductase subunit C [Chloroflexi bacterium]|nr:NADH-quinone oxidoreductase subunit C [Chloroflexota bacterium]
MTIALSGEEVAAKLERQFPGSIVASNANNLLVITKSLFDLVSFLKTTPGFEFDYLSSITAVDYYDYFELVYHLIATKHNHSLVLKTRCYQRENPTAPSIVSLYQGADFQEREIYDLMGIRFEGHPNMKRIFLWEGFAGHPLRKDYL